MYCNTITSPNYPFNYQDRVDKDFKIEVAVGQKIEIIFTEFDIENHRSCSWDWVVIGIIWFSRLKVIVKIEL